MQKLRTFKFLLLGLIFLGMAACHSGGEVASGSEGTLSPVFVQAPTIAVPANSPFYSKDDSIVIGGLCNNGYIVRIVDTLPQETPCTNSQYSFEIEKGEDGIYPFSITQWHPQNGTSQENVLIWVRKSSVTPPTLTSPNFSPFPSGNSVLTLTGGCETGSTIEVTGDVSGETVCSSSTFNLSLVSYDTGNLNLTIEQVDQAGNNASLPFVWRRFPLQAIPSAPQVAAGSTTVFTPTGGSESYTSALTSNNSGASFDPNTHTYIAGTLANTTDTIRFTDSLGETIDVAADVIPGAVDHFQMAAVSGNSQIEPINTLLPVPLRVEVVDRYSNPIPDIPVVFTVVGGDATIETTPFQTTDATGGAEVQVRLGNQHYRNVIGVKPATGVFPDIAGTGNDIIAFNVFSQAQNSNKLANLLATANQPTVLISDDFTGNGNNDIGVLNASDPSVGFMQGLGNGLFETMTKVMPICANPSDMVTGDFNGDSLLDLALACGGANQIAILLKLADNSGFAAVEYIDVNPIEALPVAIEQADFDDDGIIDIITASASGNSVSLRLGLGDGTFDNPLYFAVGSSPSGLSIGDFNNDDLPDVAVLNAGDLSAGLLLNNAMGGFFAHYDFPVGAGPADIIAADFNNDGFDDISTTNNIDDNISVLINDNFAGFLGPDNYPVGSGPISLAASDLDGDGFKDLLVTNSGSSTLSVLLGFGNGSFLYTGDIPTELNPGSLLAKDINNDGLVDVMVSTTGVSKVQIFIGQGDGTLGLERATESNPSAIRMADFDGDTYTDLVVLQQGTNNISILQGNGLGLFSNLFTISTAGSPADVAVEDFNGDSILDLAVVHRDIASFRVYMGVGDGTFNTPDYYATGLQPVAIKARDMNADGSIDLVVANGAANSISLFPNLGDGSFDNRVNFGTGSQPSAFDIADLNGDHELDIVVANAVPGSVSVLLSGGNFTFQPHIETSTGNGSSSLVVGFLNADSIIDIAVANETAGSISILIGQGNGGFTGPTDFFVAPPCRSLVALDYDGNNQTDLLVTHGASNTATILYGSGNGLFNVTQTINLPHAADTISTGDINSDGQVDFVTIDPNKPSAVMWLGD